MYAPESGEVITGESEILRHTRVSLSLKVGAFVWSNVITSESNARVYDVFNNLYIFIISLSLSSNRSSRRSVDVPIDAPPTPS